MFGPRRIYAGDIETDNSQGHGLNPAKAAITEAAIAVADGGQVFHGDELTLLDAIDTYLDTLEPGLLLTWNGSFFDLPFISDRLHMQPSYTGTWGPMITPDPQLVPKYEPLPGHAGGYSGFWRTRSGVIHQHLDVSLPYKKVAADLGVKWSLKPVCTALGIDMFELDRTRLHEYSQADRDRYNLSDSTGTRALGLRLLGWA